MKLHEAYERIEQLERRVKELELFSAKQNFIVDQHGAWWPLEFSPRVGYIDERGIADATLD